MPLEEFPDPAALAEKALCAVKVGHDDASTVPIDGNLALGSRRAVRPANRIVRKLVEEAPQIDVVAIDVARRDFGRADGARNILM